MSCKSQWNFFSTYSWDHHLRVETLSCTCDKRENEGRRITTWLPSCYFWIWVAFLPLHTHPLFPQPPSLARVTSSCKHSHVLCSNSESNTWTAARGLKLRFLIASRLCSLDSVRTRENVFIAGRGGWNLAAQLSIKFFCAPLRTRLNLEQQS